jgi:uncharacterized protein YfiM (DUF2279 family)
VIEEFEALRHADEVGDTAEWIIENLQKGGVSCEVAAHSLGFALALLAGGQSQNERALLEGVITAIRHAFEDTLSAKAEILAQRQAGAVTLQ